MQLKRKRVSTLVLLTVAAFVMYFVMRAGGETDRLDASSAGPVAGQPIAEVVGVNAVRTRAGVPELDNPVAESSQKPGLVAAEVIMGTKRVLDIDISLLAENWSALVNEAMQGSTIAADSLLRGTHVCADVPSTPEDFEALLRAISTAGEAAADAESSRDFQRHRYENCAPLTFDQRASWRHWMEVAARLGSSTAQAMYLNSPPLREDEDYWAKYEGYKVVARQYLNNALESRDPYALMAAASAYGKTGGLGQDPVLSLAYLRASYMALGQLDTPTGRLVTAGLGLTTLQLREAQELSETIYNDWYARQ